MASLMERNKLGSYNKSFCFKNFILEATTERNTFVLLKYIFFLLCPEKMYPSGVAPVQQYKLDSSCDSRGNFYMLQNYHSGLVAFELAVPLNLRHLLKWGAKLMVIYF